MPDLGNASSSWDVQPAPDKLWQRVKEGYCLTDAELLQLNEQGARAAQLEQFDPNFARAARKWRAERQEAERIEGLRKELAEKKKVHQKTEARREADKKAMKDERDARDDERRRIREAHFAEKERRRQVELARLAEQERRALVRATIREALVEEARISHAEGAPRSLFNVSAEAAERPGPGSYDPPPLIVRVATFGYHDTEPPRVARDPYGGPGPAAYDIPKPRIEGGKIGGAPARPPAETASPGPAAYTPKLERKPGGRISKYNVKSDVDRAVERGADLPGPGTYDVFRAEKETRGSRAASLYGRTGMPSDVLIREESSKPGPADYDLPRPRIRGGDLPMGPARAALVHEKNPGPGYYFQTPTVAQQRELRKLSKRVVTLVASAADEGSASAAAVVQKPRKAPQQPQEAQQPGGSTATFMTDRGARAGDNDAAAVPAQRRSRLLGESVSLPSIY